MNLHEYQAKHLFAKYGMPVPKNRIISTVSEAETALHDIDTDHWVVKAQVHAGGRGKAGGVKVTNDKKEAMDFVYNILGSRLVTEQTDSKGQPVNQILIEEACDIEKELYLGVVVDRALQQVVIMASTEGGMDIEKVAAESPDKILKAAIHPMTGLQSFQARDLAFGLGLQGDQIKQFTKLLSGLAKLFIANDLSLVEINPLVITKSGELICLDGKINIDDNALYRHPKSKAKQDISQEDEREHWAKEWDLNYISLDGQIGCMVNGAGLAMATMDLIKLNGAEPANFLDVGGTATKERVAEAFKIILSDEKVKGILVNIFGGIVRCDMIAEGIIGALQEVEVKVPVVVRLEGNKAKQGLALLKDSGVKAEAVQGLQQATEKIVALVAAGGTA